MAMADCNDVVVLGDDIVRAVLWKDCAADLQLYCCDGGAGMAVLGWQHCAEISWQCCNGIVVKAAFESIIVETALKEMAAFWSNNVRVLQLFTYKSSIAWTSSWQQYYVVALWQQWNHYDSREIGLCCVGDVLCCFAEGSISCCNFVAWQCSSAVFLVHNTGAVTVVFMLLQL